MTNIIYPLSMYVKPINPNHSGAQALFARVMGWNSSQVNDLVRGRINAGPERARMIVARIGGDIDNWLRGGDVSARRAAIEAWAARQNADFVERRDSSGLRLGDRPARIDDDIASQSVGEPLTLEPHRQI